MLRTYILKFATTLILSISPLMAETNQDIKPTDAQVEAIIAEIEKAKIEPKETEKKSEKVEQEVKQVTIKTKPALKKIEKKVISQHIKKTTRKVSEKKTHIFTMPKVPKPPKAIELSTVKLIDSEGHILTERIEELCPPRKKPIFTNRVAPPRFYKGNKSTNNAQKEIMPGDIKNARVTAYIQSPLLSVDEVVAKLKRAEFKVLSQFKVDKKGKVVSIVFTNEALEKAAAKKMRGFASTLRIVVDTKNKLVNISNPLYVMKAFMQKEYDATLAEKTLTQIRAVFSDLKNSNEVVKFSALERYRFMENMPYYQDMEVIAKAKNTELLKRAEKSKKVVYTQHLANGSIILGVKLGKRTSKFVKKIGFQNSALLPYPVLIENGEAKILAPQYYIAVMYPMLKMSKFMTIATVPGAITKDIDRIFR